MLTNKQTWVKGSMYYSCWPSYLQASHPRIQPTNPGWLNPGMWNLWIWRASYVHYASHFIEWTWANMEFGTQGELLEPIPDGYPWTTVFLQHFSVKVSK